MTDRQYMILPADAVPLIDFALVCETSAETLRYSVDGTQTFVKWDGQRPACTEGIEGAQGPYSHSEILDILSGPSWTLEETMYSQENSQ